MPLHKKLWTKISNTKTSQVPKYKIKLIMLNALKIKISLRTKFNKHIVLYTLFLCCKHINIHTIAGSI